MNCSICGREIEKVLMSGNSVWTEGHNAQPVNDGRCCGACNDMVVIPRRLQDMTTYEMRVSQLETEGMTRSDAQAAVDAEDHNKMLKDLDDKFGIKSDTAAAWELTSQKRNALHPVVGYDPELDFTEEKETGEKE